MGTLQPYLILIIPVVTASLAQLLFKKGVLALGKLDFSLTTLLSLLPQILCNVWLVLGIILFGISFLVYLFVLSRIQLNIIYPIFVSAAIVFISLASWFFFKESLSWLQILGIVLIIFGIFLLGVKTQLL